MFQLVNCFYFILWTVEQCQHLFYFVDLNYVLCKSCCLVKVKWRSPFGIYAVCHPKILFRKKIISFIKHLTNNIIEPIIIYLFIYFENLLPSNSMNVNIIYIIQ